LLNGQVAHAEGHFQGQIAHHRRKARRVLVAPGPVLTELVQGLYLDFEVVDFLPDIVLVQQSRFDPP
jgi:hypothetical protein